MQTLVLFAHGKESGPWGSKIKHLAAVAERLGAQVLSPDYGDLPDPDARVARLRGMPLPAHDRLVLVGSSMGGYVSTVASQGMAARGLFLMAPAFYMPGYAVQDPVPGTPETCVVFGWCDTVIPVAHGIRFAQAHCAALHVLDSDHRLNSLLPEVGALFEDYLRRVMAAA